MVKDVGTHELAKGEDVKGRVKALKEGIQSITDITEHKADKVEKAATEAAKKATDPLIHKLRQGQKLSKEEDAFILPYFSADSSDLARLYEDLGLPGEQEAKSAKLNVYAQLCLEFEKKLQEADAQDMIDSLEGAKVDEGQDADERNLHIDQQIEITKDEAQRKAKRRALKAYGDYKKLEES